MPRRSNPHIPSTLRAATDPVFHYTSADGLLGIVESGCLRASEASGLNDVAEVRQGWQLIEEWLAHQPKSDAVDMLSDLAKHPLQEPREVFVLSGSTAADDANQWRLYAQGGRGYALELDPSVELVAVTRGEPLKPPKPRKGRIVLGWEWGDSVTVTPWLHVLYDPTEVAAALTELVKTTGPALAGVSRASFEEYDSERTELKGDLYEALALIAHLTKAPGFEGEREVRVVTTYLFESQHIQYRSGAYGIVSFGLLTRSPKDHDAGRIFRSPKLAQGKRPGKQLPITSVRLGPLLQPEHDGTVRSFLAKNKLSGTKVVRSDVPLR